MENAGICASITNEVILSWGRNSHNLSLVACLSLQIEGDSAKYLSINEQTPVKKKFIVEGKLELLTKCVESFLKPISQPGESGRYGEKTKLARPTHNIDYGEEDL